MKPENFLMGNDSNPALVYLVDFGLSKKYITEEGKHIESRSDRKLVGTARYASIQTHNGKEQGRRDDLESICYIMLYFIKGHLPWEGMLADTKAEKYKMIGQLKEIKTPDMLFKGLPSIIISKK